MTLQYAYDFIKNISLKRNDKRLNFQIHNLQWMHKNTFAHLYTKIQDVSNVLEQFSKEEKNIDVCKVYVENQNDCLLNEVLRDFNTTNSIKKFS